MCTDPDQLAADKASSSGSTKTFIHTMNPRAPDKSVYWKTIFFISHPKHMLWVLKRTVSMRQFF